MAPNLAQQLKSELAAGFSYHSLGAVVQHCDKELSRAEALDGIDAVTIFSIREICSSVRDRLDALQPVNTTVHQSIEHIVGPPIDATVRILESGADISTQITVLKDLIVAGERAVRTR